MALAGSNIADPGDAFSVNPAMDSAKLVAMSYSPSPYSIEGSWLASVNACYSFDQLNHIAVATAANTFQSIYSEQRASIQYARAFLVSHGDTVRSIRAGVRLNYSSEHFGDGYLPLNEMTADLGTSFDLLSNLRVGVAVTDLTTITRNQAVPSEPRTAFAGISWRALEDVTIHCAMEAPQGVSTSLLTAVECALDTHITVRAGAETAIGELTAGVGLHYSNLQLDMAVLRHPVLGSTLAFGLQYGL